MPLLETVVIQIGSSLAKSLAKLCLKNVDIASDASSSLIDVVTSWTSNSITQRRAARQLEAIGENIAENFLPLFELEGHGLEESSQIAVAKAVSETLNNITSQIVLQNDLEPSKLTRYLLDKYPAQSYYFNDTEATLYQRIIAESCEVVIRIASQLPTFTEHTISEILRREGYLRSIAENILQEVLRLREQMNPRTETARFELDYRRAVAYKLDEVQLFGVDVERNAYKLSVAYVMLSLERKKRALDDSRIKRKHKSESSNSITGHHLDRDILSVDKALAEAQCILIRGLAGSGKTTLLQWIAVNSALKTFKGVLANWNNTVPFYIKLRDYVHLDFPPPESFIKKIVPSIADTMPRGWVHTELKTGNAIILIDGIDEVPIAQREIVREWIKDLKNSYPQARFIVTTRPHAIQEGWLEVEGFKDAELEPMDLADIYTFIDYWHNAIAERVATDEEKQDLPSFAEHLKHEIDEDRAKRNLATNPLLCAMLCALNRKRKKQLPSARIELYEACCQLLIERRDNERGLVLSDYPAASLTYAQKRLLLEDLAYWLIKNSWSEVSREEADQRFARKLENMPNIPQNVTGVKARQFFVERSGIIREPTTNQLDFTHRTFQEFFAAKAAIDEGDSGLLVQNAHNDQWREVIILASGLATKRVRESLILKLIRRGDLETENRHALYLLAVACLESGIEHLGQHVRTEVSNRLGALVPPRDMDAARALASAGDLAVRYLNTQNTQDFQNKKVRLACIRSLTLIGSPEALKVLREYAFEADSPTINALLRGWDSFDRKSYAQLVLLKALKNMSQAQIERFSSQDGFLYLDNVEELDLADCPFAKSIIDVLDLTKLALLDLSGCSSITDVQFLKDARQLIELDLSHCSHIDDFGPLSSLNELTELSLSNCSQLKNLQFLEGVTHLTSLDVSDCGQILDLSSLKKLPDLSELSLAGCYKLQDLSPLAQLVNLTKLDLSDCVHLKDITPLSKLHSLTHLYLANCPKISDLKPLGNLLNLKVLNVQGHSVENLPEAIKSLNKKEKIIQSEQVYRPLKKKIFKS
ncbi:ATP-binding protein [Ktedonobacter sp. SOSP1-85]|uniref:NACHT N-terminal Helical domain 1-containing protein n=1 Tax=Ktedonobacter sp. SOSP1-85 TaxID=2778367 RepID=UPI001914FA6A|nr:leucine-rich repeat domain-containing protein [Ktedonobacter sp. SOSP1-85]GHO79507.1 ATP-binding protein [Ktedonobacter sp. SOSP1-85]